MRLVCVADTHLYESGFEIPDGDVFIHAGDLLRRGTLEELAPAAEWIRGLPHRHKVVVAGNHDWCFVRDPQHARAALGPTVHYLQDTEITIDGARIWGSPWQPEFFSWAFNLARGPEIAARWALIPAAVDVLITHGPPRGYGDLTQLSHEGCDDLLAELARVQPALHLFGHIHEDGGSWRHGPTVIANVTTWECSRDATVFDYDPKTRTVVEVCVPPTSTC
ncbi:MAG: metallophosphatase domain-containing protein [Nannocystaceae bacterium]|nr:metallophosphatase domain-containing protein [Nannocystaceae bacterium]